MPARKSELVRIGYTKIAEKYHRQRNRYASRTLLQKFARLLPKGSRVLDLGCGAGVPVDEFLADRGYNVTGIDFAEGMLKLARKNVPNASFRKMDITKMKFTANSFGGAVSFYAIIHIPREKHAVIYKRLHRILRPDAVMLINASGTDSWEGYAEDYLGVRMFWSFFNPRKTLKLIKYAGFEVLWSKALKIGGEKQFWVLAKNAK
jgi:ubiquinone/menaquinone biosynthesis C-methylase UbiE